MEKRPAAGKFHARLQQIEKDLYRAQYGGEFNPDNPDEREIPDYHIGTSADGVKNWVEEMARGMGYEQVVWDELPAD